MKKKMTLNQKLGLGLLIAAPFVIAACDTEQEPKQPEPKKCECPNGTQHYMPCGCEVESPNTCDCKVIPRGYVIDAERGINVPIYQKISNISDVIVNNIKEGYNIMSVDSKDKFMGASNFKEVWIVEGGWDESSFDSATGVVKLGLDLNVSQIRGVFRLIVTPELTYNETAMLRNLTQSVVERRRIMTGTRFF